MYRNFNKEDFIQADFVYLKVHHNRIMLSQEVAAI